MPYLRPLLALSVCAALVACCSRASIASSTTTSVAIHVPGRPDAKAVPGVITVEVDVSAAQSTTTTTTNAVNVNGVSTQTSIVVDGQRIEVVGNELHAFGKRYGPLVPGTLVRVSSTGATVDGRELEPLD